MRRLKSAFALTTMALLAGCASYGSLQTSQLATAQLLTASDKVTGSAVMTVKGDAVLLNVSVSGISPGPHGIHLHAVGTCAPPAFTSAGPHLNPGGHQHGIKNPLGRHLGDLPNIVAESSGSGILSVQLQGSPAELEAALFDNDGTALVIHAGPDDNMTDPSGNSGARIVCGVLKRG